MLRIARSTRWRPTASAAPTDATAPGAAIAQRRTWRLVAAPVAAQVAKCSQLFLTRWYPRVPRRDSALAMIFSTGRRCRYGRTSTGEPAANASSEVLSTRRPVLREPP